MEPQRSKAFAWLAASSALLVLLASGVAISRLGDDDGDTRVASAPTTQPTTALEGGDGGSGSGQPGSGLSGATGSTAGGTATGASGANATSSSSSGGSSGYAATGAQRAARTTAGGQRTSGATGSQGDNSTGADARAGAEGSTQGTPPGQPQSSGDTGQPQGGAGDTEGSAPGGDGPSGGQDSPPGPSQQPPEQDSRLVGASASAGEGAQGGVIGVAVDGTSLDVDLTLGRDQLVGNHPPSEGTGVSFGGRLLNPPSAGPAIPSLPG